MLHHAKRLNVDFAEFDLLCRVIRACPGKCKLYSSCNVLKDRYKFTLFDALHWTLANDQNEQPTHQN